MSSKHNNPKDKVLFATNINQYDLPVWFVGICERNDVDIKYIPFDRFVLPDNYKWSLAFYKLNVLSYLLEMEFGKMVYMDTDVFVQNSFADIWTELDEHILMYDISHGLGVENYRIFIDEVSKFLVERRIITHYGGEFFACNKNNGKKFIVAAERVYRDILDKKYETTKGDEFIISLAADSVIHLIRNASPYVYRFWTGADFRLVSTCYKYNPVSVLHMPNEKKQAL